jgi:hypothetical protein
MLTQSNISTGKYQDKRAAALCKSLVKKFIGIISYERSVLSKIRKGMSYLRKQPIYNESLYDKNLTEKYLLYESSTVCKISGKELGPKCKRAPQKKC